MQRKNNRDKFIKTVESARVPGMGPGESYMGLFGTVRTARRLLVKNYVGQKTFNKGWGPYLRGPADDITLRHYGTCDICRSFSDAFYVTAPATIICVRKRRCQPHVQ